MYIKYDPMKNGLRVHYWEFGCECGDVMWEETSDKEEIDHKIQTLFDMVMRHIEKPHRYKIGDYVVISMFEHMGLTKHLNTSLLVE